ncbi:MAG: hypothetical protein M3295_02880 [Chloroflexota bacterium]|nr:hypothetical protein [Chloroflexota bacterium]
MTDSTQTTGSTATTDAGVSGAAAADLQRIVESANRLGVEIDEAEALRWLTALAATPPEGDIVMDVDAGVFGHRVSMLDFSRQDLARFREIGKIVGFEDRPGVETALALSGSAAQSKIQTHPGDCDYFERVNIKAESRAAASAILADLIRDKALSSLRGPNHQLVEVKFGSYPFDVLRDGQPRRKGSPVSWSPSEVQAGRIAVTHRDGTPDTLEWSQVAAEPGWCKLDWVVADPARRQLANASNMLDVTWEAPDGSITPLDGYLDPYFQEIYLEAESVPVFAKLAKHVSADSLDEYVRQLENEVRKYLAADHLNYGKAAKRMYNIFRLTGRYVDAAFVRELFDEPATVLYQVWSLIQALDNAIQERDSGISLDAVIAQADELIINVTRALEGEEETEIVRSLLRLRDSLVRRHSGDTSDAEVEACRSRVINVVNNFFGERLNGVPTIKSYIDSFRS